jgi:hypothetical protein
LPALSLVKGRLIAVHKVIARTFHAARQHRDPQQQTRNTKNGAHGRSEEKSRRADCQNRSRRAARWEENEEGGSAAKHGRHPSKATPMPQPARPITPKSKTLPTQTFAPRLIKTGRKSTNRHVAKTHHR